MNETVIAKSEKTTEFRTWRGHLVLLLFAAALGLAVHSRAVTTIFSTGGLGQEAPLTTGQEDYVSMQAAFTDVEENAPAEFDIDAIPVLVDNALHPALNPFTFRPKEPAHAFITYTVQSGDTAVGIAETFGIREETILGGNSFLQNDAGQLWAGTEIVILPVDGVLHDVIEGDTLEGLSTQYDVALEEIVAYAPNSLEFPYRLIAGTQLLIPGAIAEVWFWDPPSYAPPAGGSSPEALQGVYVAVPGTGTFVRPWAGGNITQNPWYGHMAVDIGLVIGSPIYASDTGTVTYAAWSPYGYGNLVVINHGNGFETFYAHLNGFDVQPGQTVYQGSLIAWSGNTGQSSGPHLHFEIRFQKQRQNPWTYLP
jgi:murein DD-endopeptidase MepM/ murein hydrolase activator NlpD